MFYLYIIIKTIEIMAKKYTVKITGGGTFAEIRDALENLMIDLNSIMYGTKPGELELPNDFEREDPTLFTEIVEEEE